MRVTHTLTISALLVLLPFAVAHDFNHADRHEFCSIYGDPDAEAIGDGHLNHKHDPVAAASLHNHDPCKQAGMQYPSVTDQQGLVEISLEDAVKGDGDPATSEVIYGKKEAFRFPVTMRPVQTNLIIPSDAVADADDRIRGTGTPADPFIIEGFVIRNVLELRDTSKCYVVRNNLIESEGIVGPLIDPTDIVILEDLRATFEALRDEAEATLADLAAQLADWDALKAPWDADKADLDATKAGLDAEMAEWQAAFDAFESSYLAFVDQEEALANDFVAYAAEYAALTAPDPAHRAHLADLDLLIPAFEDYMPEVEDLVLANPPPADPPAGSSWDADSWPGYRDAYSFYSDSVPLYAAEYWDELIGSRPDEDAFATFSSEYDAFYAEYDAFMADYLEFMADYGVFRTAHDTAKAAAEGDLEEVADYEAKAAAYDVEFTGLVKYVTGEVNLLAASVKELVDKLLDLVIKKLTPNANTGRLVLDWNGQCIHAYNNVAEDLRVNQNNDRRGYATGGVLEDNRFYTIGQIRHYDGVFRQNEVGNRAHLQSLVDPAVAAPANDRSINNDGANQGWFHHNLIYGNVDLDFHGHHHAPGFFAPESHYHGSVATVAYMTNSDGSFKTFPNGERIPHHDHAKRWTSVRFEDNVVIDPKGVGLRFEDQQHRQDDEKANSENMVELKRPHLHRTEVEMSRNVVVGKIGVDVLNAEGTWLWSDTWTEPKQDLVGRITDAVEHMGADIVNSHRERNDAWVDLKGNTQFLVGGGTGIRLVQAKQANEIEVDDNKAFVLGTGFNSGKTASELLGYLRAAAGQSADTTWSTVSGWGGTRTAATGIEVTNMRDSKLTYCGNDFRGYTRGLRATNQVYTDVTIDGCGTSTWGAADPAVEVAFTPYPPAPPQCTKALRDTTDATQAKYVLRPTWDATDAQPVLCQVLPQSTPLPDTVKAVTSAAPLPKL